MNSVATNKLIIGVLIAAVLGILFGWLMPGLMLAFAFIGDLFINVLQIIFIPLVASAIITGVSAFANSRQTVRAAFSTLFLFVSTTVVAVAIGLVLAVIIQPGAGINTGAAFVPPEIINAPLTQSLDFLNELVPSNIVASVIHGKFLGWMLVLTIAAGILGTLGQRAKPLTDFFEVIFTVVQKVLEKLMYFIPIGVFFVMGAVIARNAGYFGSITGALGKLSLVLLLAFLIHAFVIIPILLKFRGNRSPVSYFTNVFPALKTALVTASPTAALPVTFENSTERNRIDDRVSALVLPIGSSLNVNGRALYVTVCALFVAQAYGLDLGFAGVLYVAMASIFFSIGTAVVPFAAMLSLVAVFDASNFSNAAFAGIGLVFVIDWFWGRIFAALDVWSDTAVAAVVEENLIGEMSGRSRSVSRPEPRREHGRGQRDYQDRQPRYNDRGRGRSRERGGQRPYSQPAREPVRSTESSSESTSYTRTRSDSRPSPFELKPDKSFDIEAAKAGETKSESSAPIDRKEALPDRRDRRKIRERKKYTRGHETSDSESASTRSRSRSSAKTTKSVSSAPVSSVSPPPLIRDIEQPAPASSEEISSAKKETKPEPKAETKTEPKAETKPEPKTETKSEPKVESVPEEVQTSLFGRGTRLKKPRPKPKSDTEPSEDSETYPKENQEFGRSTRRKKPK